MQIPIRTINHCSSNILLSGKYLYRESDIVIIWKRWTLMKTIMPKAVLISFFTITGSSVKYIIMIDKLLSSLLTYRLLWFHIRLLYYLWNYVSIIAGVSFIFIGFINTIVIVVIYLCEIHYLKTEKI